MRSSPDPIPLHNRALEDLTFIRDTMERAGTVTSVPGWGGMAMGATALVASGIAARQGSGAEWLAVWLSVALELVQVPPNCCHGGVQVTIRQTTGPVLDAGTSRLHCP